MDPRSYRAQEEASIQSGGFIPHPMAAPHQGVNLSGTPLEAAILAGATKPNTYGSSSASSGASTSSSGSMKGVLTLIEAGVIIWWVFAHYGLAIDQGIARAGFTANAIWIKLGIGAALALGYGLALAFLLKRGSDYRWLTLIAFAALWAFVGYYLAARFGAENNWRLIAAGVCALIGFAEKYALSR